MKSPPWKAFQPTLPLQTTNLPMDRVRENFIAADMYNVVSAFMVTPGWNMTNSFVRGLANPGTASAPTAYYWHRGEGNDRQWIKQVMQYEGGSSWVGMVYYYSNNNEATYVPMLDAEGNYVFQLNYDSGGNVTTSYWGADTSVPHYLLEDGSFFILLEDGTSHIALGV